MKKLCSVFLVAALILCPVLVMPAAAAAPIGITYDTYVQRTEWQPYVESGALAGTTGKALRVEALSAKLIGDVPASVKLTYKAYVQRSGWQAPVSDGVAAGTVGKSLRLEAFRMTLSGMSGYEVEYRAYIQRVGWQPWKVTKNGTSINTAAMAGTMGKSLRIEAVEILIKRL